MNTAKMLQFFDTRTKRGDPLVLATVYETAGSTYSKAGAQMLIDSNGVFRGMLSGGCLEGDLAIRAQQVLESGTPCAVTYELSEEDELWGMGVGCDGLMRVLLQPLLPQDDYAPYSQIADVLRGHTAREIVIAAGIEPPGDLKIVVRPPPQLLVLGAGLDAEPVVRFAAELGWRCTIADHRQAYIDNGDFASAERALCAPVAELGRNLDLSLYDLAVVMSHHLASDRGYLVQLAETEIGYIGLLGPSNRRERLLSDIGAVADQLKSRLHGPAGLDLGGRGPAPIALSIVAQMQEHLADG